MRRSLLAVLAVAGFAGTALADLPFLYCTGFEPNDYTVGVLTGQDDWFLPSVAGSQNYNVAAYGGPIAANPNGGVNYARGTPLSATEFARAQHAVPFADNTSYILSYDINALPYASTPPAVNNIGSFSTQDSATTRFTQSLFVWNDLNNPDAGWTTQIVNIDSTGANLGFMTPADPAFTSGQFNHWYHQEMLIDFTTNQLLSITTTDLATNATATVTFTNIYLGGGANNATGLALPTAIRMFTGGNQNITTLWDNVCVSIVPAPATGTLALLGLGAFARRRRH
jgi:hypothetical protein